MWHSWHLFNYEKLIVKSDHSSATAKFMLTAITTWYTMLVWEDKKSNLILCYGFYGFYGRCVLHFISWTFFQLYNYGLEGQYLVYTFDEPMRKIIEIWRWFYRYMVKIYQNTWLSLHLSVMMIEHCLLSLRNFQDFVECISLGLFTKHILGSMWYSYHQSKEKNHSMRLLNIQCPAFQPF